MVQKLMQFVGMEKLVNCDAYGDILLAQSTDFDEGLREFKRLLKENQDMDEDFKQFLTSIVNKAESVDSREKRKETDDDHEHDDDHDGDDSDQEPRKKQREREDDVFEHDVDCYDVDDYDNDGDEDENDPRYEFFLKHLRKHEKFYALEYEKDGIPVVLKYAEDSSSDDESDQEPRRKLRSAMKQNDAPASHQMPCVGNQAKNDSLSTSSEETINLTRRKLRNKAKSEKAQNVKCPTNETVPDPDYLAFTRALKTVGDHYVFTYEGHTVVYEMNSGGNNLKKKENHDESCSEVEIIDWTSFYKKGNANPSTMNGDSILNRSSRTMQSEFRHQVITLLRKPFDREEYDKLWSEVKLRKLEKRHMDLRNGRERSCSTQKIGKSYLDYYPDLRSKLRHVQYDKSKRLNILRGFFFWLQNVVQNGSFRPWEDDECLAIKPEPC